MPDFLHEMFLDLWLRYVLIGGMPEAVQVFADTTIPSSCAPGSEVFSTHIVPTYALREGSRARPPDQDHIRCGAVAAEQGE